MEIGLYGWPVTEQRREVAARHGITVVQEMRAEMAYLLNEGYDDDGNEYDTLDAYIGRKPVHSPYEPYDGGRGAGMLGVED